MFKTVSDYMIFAGVVFCICAVISILITLIWMHNILRINSNSKDKIIFHKEEWNKNNKKKTLVPVFLYIILYVVLALFKLNKGIILMSFFLILDFFYVNIISMKYVETNVLAESKTEK